MFSSESNIYNNFDEKVDDTNNYRQKEFLNTLLPYGLSPRRLELKINCSIILFRNLDPSKRLCSHKDNKAKQINI